MSSGIDYYDLQTAKDDLQRQVWDLQRRLEDLDREHREARREAHRDLADGLSELGERVHKLEAGARTP